MSPTHQDLSNDTTFNQIKSRVPVFHIKLSPFSGGLDVLHSGRISNLMLQSFWYELIRYSVRRTHGSALVHILSGQCYIDARLILDSFPRHLESIYGHIPLVLDPVTVGSLWLIFILEIKCRSIESYVQQYPP